MAEDRVLRVLLCDDEPGMRLILRKLVERAEGFSIVGEAEDGEEGLRLFEELRPDVVFLDVDMPRMNGVETAKRIQDMDPRAALVFATAYEGYRDEAFEVYAFDYLVKPFKNERVLATLERIRSLLAGPARREADPQRKPKPPQRKRRDRLLLRSRDGVVFLDMEDILLVQRENRQTVLYTADGSYSTSDSLAEVEERLDPELFFRCHKSYIINLSCIDSITPYGRWTYVVQLHGTSQDALITHEKYEELEKLYS
ncbi:MAG: LytR/AlgR family response regulator transcription factor [Candidatus Spyradocola sp.]|jgi:two-component system LytT family response regulator